jgi:hypothetical protein
MLSEIWVGTGIWEKTFNYIPETGVKKRIKKTGSRIPYMDQQQWAF